ncbi:MAG: hypothetical protein Q7T55_05410 [Solirubrobacteraceae bacterium]|nr:hypothetical protein [Solirubrobacteraceae bacterium]
MRSRLKSDGGQASVEHIGLMALVAVLLLAATAIVGAASPGLRNAVRDGFMHALCVVTGGGCDSLAREPCPTLRTVKTTGQGLGVSYLRLGHDKVLSIERRSDGTYGLSVIEGFSTGGGIALERGRGAFEASAEAKLMLGHRAGRTYVAATQAEAQALAKRLKKEHLTEARTLVAGAADLLGLASTDPSVESYVLAGDGAFEALGKFGLGGIIEGGGKAGNRTQIGVKINPREQEITAFASVDARAGVFFEALNELAGPVGRGRAGGGPPAGGGTGQGGGGGIDLRKPGAPDTSASEDTRTRVSVKNPLAQKLEGEVMGGGTIALRFGPGRQLRGIEVVGYAGVNGKLRELRARLDPNDSRVLAALAQWQRDPTSATAIADLGRAASTNAALDVRTFDTKRTEHPGGFGGKAHALTLEVGYGSASDVSKLTSQRSRPPGGEWEDRTDCVMATKG